MRSLVIASAIVIVAPLSAQAHDLEHPERNAWMARLENAAGVYCCQPDDTNAVHNVDWATWRDPEGVAHYRIFIESDWLKVDDSAIVHAPNPYREPIAWIVHESGIPHVKCFLPGSGM